MCAIDDRLSVLSGLNADENKASATAAFSTNGVVTNHVVCPTDVARNITASDVINCNGPNSANTLSTSFVVGDVDVKHCDTGASPCDLLTKPTSSDVNSGMLCEASSTDVATGVGNPKKPKRKRKKNKNDVEKICAVSDVVNNEQSAADWSVGRRLDGHVLQPLVSEHNISTDTTNNVANVLSSDHSSIAGHVALLGNASPTAPDLTACITGSVNNGGLSADKVDSFKGSIVASGQSLDFSITKADRLSGVSLDVSQHQMSGSILANHAVSNVEQKLTNSCTSAIKLQPETESPKLSLRAPEDNVSASIPASQSHQLDRVDKDLRNHSTQPNSTMIPPLASNLDNRGLGENIVACSSLTPTGSNIVPSFEGSIKPHSGTAVSQEHKSETIATSGTPTLPVKELPSNHLEQNCADDRLPNLVEGQSHNRCVTPSKNECCPPTLKRHSPSPPSISLDRSVIQRRVVGDLTTGECEGKITGEASPVEFSSESSASNGVPPNGRPVEDKEEQNEDGDDDEDTSGRDQCARIDFVYDITKRKRHLYLDASSESER